MQTFVMVSVFTLPMQCNPNQTVHNRHVSEIKCGDGKMYRGLTPTPRSREAVFKKALA